MKKLLALVAAGTLLAGCGLNLPGVQTNTTKFGAKRVLPKGAKKWTIMVHLAADNNLYSFGLEDMNEMEAGINSDDVNVIVLFDGTKQGDSAVYEIKHDANGKNSTLVSVPNTDVPFIPASHEINSGDPSVLKAFGEWAVQKYPAEHYMVSVWDHGSGIFRRGTYNSTEFFYKGFGWDDNGSHMNTSDLSTIVPAMARAAGQPIDIVGFDACLMGHVELAYQLKGAANYLVASEELEPGPGWDYMNWLKNVTASSTPVQAAAALVKSYGDSYKAGGSQNTSGRATDYTLSATDINALTGSLVPAMNNFSSVLTGSLGTDKAAISSARASTQSFYNRDCADLGHFVTQLLASNASSGVKGAAQDVQAALAKTVVAETHTGKVSESVTNAQGLVVYFPGANQSYNAKYDDPKAIAFANESWKDFLKAFLKK
ncbi:MAG TPA: clostripain-related cysteine peptidase [Stenomitos sp.]